MAGMTTEQAREFFREYRGRHFHMARDDEYRWQLYKSLGITEETEAVWRRELKEEDRAKGIIRTERLILRRVTASDWKALRNLWDDFSMSPYARYDRPNDTDDEIVKERIERWAKEAGGDDHIFFAACLGETLIGYIVFHKSQDGYETGYMFHSTAIGRGFASEGFEAALEYIRETGAKYVYAGTAIKNTPSVKFLERNGFKLKGTEPVSFYRDEKGEDIVFTGGIFELKL